MITITTISNTPGEPIKPTVLRRSLFTFNKDAGVVKQLMYLQNISELRERVSVKRWVSVEMMG